MLLALSIISPQAETLGATAYKVFDERGGTIGRIAGNDWVLPDPDNYVSSRHANVRWIAGAFYLEDTSSNGTFINAPDRPVGRAQRVRLQDGDRLFIGDFEIIVQLIDAAPAMAAPAASSGAPLATVDPLAALGVGTDSAAASPSPPPAAAAIPGNWEITGFDPHAANRQPAATPSPQAPSAPPPTPAPSGGSVSDLLSALGLDPAQVDPTVQQQLGAILRIAVQGLVDVLKSRAEVKNTFRLPMTIVKPVENNPLKFSMNAEDALYNLFVKRNPGYLGPVDAFEEGFRDVSFHQAAVLVGIRAAFDSMLAKLHPRHLEELYERKVRRTAMLGVGARGKYWELYRERFEEIDRDREAHFQLLFGEEFARAYDEHLQKLALEARRRRR